MFVSHLGDELRDALKFKGPHLEPVAWISLLSAPSYMTRTWCGACLKPGLVVPKGEGLSQAGVGGGGGGGVGGRLEKKAPRHSFVIHFRICQP